MKLWIFARVYIVTVVCIEILDVASVPAYVSSNVLFPMIQWKVTIFHLKIVNRHFFVSVENRDTKTSFYVPTFPKLLFLIYKFAPVKSK